MLSVSPLNHVNSSKHDHESQNGASSETSALVPDEFPEFEEHNNLLETIDFDDIFIGIDCDDILPDLVLPDFTLGSLKKADLHGKPSRADEKCVRVSSKEDEGVDRNLVEEGKTESRPNNDGEKRKSKSSKGKVKGSCHGITNNNTSGKRKVKVDWTPELHRRFVQAVEQLGVDKAVPSRILELMGIDSLTRHNVASHLQKYRSHRKHLLAREAEAATWSHKRHVYDIASGKNNWMVPPALGYPPPMHHPHHFRPLHVWGHPPPLLPPHHAAAWGHPPPPHDPSFYWNRRIQPPASGFAQRFPVPTAPSSALTVPGMPSAPPGTPGCNAVPAVNSHPRSPIDIHPSKESIDAAIGDVLTKKWLRLPLGLKPPRMETVMVELQRQGVSKIPPSETLK